jgi:hypothetical protein
MFGTGSGLNEAYPDLMAIACSRVGIGHVDDRSFLSADYRLDPDLGE